MPDDLVKKFFSKDLTEAEEQALAETLSTSEAAAEEFGGTAEGNYDRYGLPQAAWPDSLPSPIGKGRGFQPWVWVLAAGFLGGMVFWGWQHRETFQQSFRPAGADPATVPETPGQGRGLERAAGTGHGSEDVPGTAPREDSIEEELRKDLEEGAQGGAPPASPRNAGPGTVKPSGVLTPVNVQDAPGRTFSEIAVKVNRAEPGQVSVRVLDMSGLEVVPLYSGPLGAGQWVFEWDGKLPGGGKASPGVYQVEVQSGSYRGLKNIRIR
jgi:hypothetical protein